MLVLKTHIKHSPSPTEMSFETPNKLQYSFNGKKVLVTGGGRGVGHALVSRLYHDGATVFTLERDPELVSQLLKDFPDRSRLRAEVCDVTKWSQTQALIASFGPVDHLVHCAAICSVREFLNLSEDDVSKTMAVNLNSVFCTSQAVAKQMISNGIQGTIVNIASIAAHVGAKGVSVYSAAKGGVIMLTKCLAVELGQHGIRVNSVSPTGIDTPMFEEVTKEINSKFGSNKALGRQPFQGKNVLEEDDVVNSILFLLSPLSSLANGMDLVLDGGILAC